MDGHGFSVSLAFFWYGFSLVFFLFTCIDRIDKAGKLASAKLNTSGGQRVGIAERLFLLVIILVGVWGLATLLGDYNPSVDYINQFMIIGCVVGILLSSRIVGRPRLPFLGKGR